MGQVVLNVDEDVATWSTGIAAGAGLHLPIGTYGGATYRSAVRFNPPAGWTGWTGITKATLSFYISDFDHVAPRNSSIYVRRQSSTAIWTKAAGTQNCESGFSGSNTTQYDDIQGVSTDQVTLSTGTTANAKKSVTVTAQVQYYHDQNTGKLVFVFERVSSSDYSELWSESKSGGYDCTLTIDYEDNTVPDAPTLVAPGSGNVSITQTPDFDWTHNDPQGDPQASADVEVWDAAGTTQVGTTRNVPGTTSHLVWPVNLSRGTSYQWRVRTYDALGFGAWSVKRPISIKAAPVTTIDATRYMEMSGGLPRLRVKWSCTQTQASYRIQAGAYDSGTVAGTTQSVLLSSLALTNGTAVSVTVTVTTTDGLTDGDTRSFTPRWGQSTHRIDLATGTPTPGSPYIPTNWGTPTISQTVPSGATLVLEYGSSATAAGTPTGGWFSSLSSVTKRRYVHYRVTLIPSATTGPSLNKIAIPADFAVASVDHWYDTPGLATLAPPWSIDSGEYVYGTRSLTRDGDGTVDYAYSERIRLRAGRSYILTGLMKSQGNSQARFQLYDADEGTVPDGIDGTAVQSELLAATRDWFEADQLDVYRYRSPVFVAPADMDVQVRCRVGGAAGTQAWFDGLKLEESTVATPWGPSAVGAVSVDAGGVQVDGSKGGVFRLRTATGKLFEMASGGMNMDGVISITNGELWIRGPGTSAILVDPDPTRTGQFMFQLNQQTGTLSWGPGGGATRDTNLYRDAANTLRTDDHFIAASANIIGGVQVASRTEWVPGRVEGFIYENVPAALAAINMSRYVQANTATFATRPISGRPGRAIGVAWRSSGTVTAGSMTLRGQRHGSTMTGADVVIVNATGTLGRSMFATPFTFTDAQSLALTIESVAGLTPLTIDIQADLLVEWEVTP